MPNYLITSLILVGAVLLPVTAKADLDITGTADVGFDTGGALGASGNDWSGGLAALFSFDQPGVNLQIGGGEDHLSISGVSLDLLNAGGDLFWRDNKGTFGASFRYSTVSKSGVNLHYVTYGLFGEWYTARNLSLRFNGGGLNGTFTGFGFSGNATGGYGSVGAEYYPIPDLGISASYQYVGISGARVHTIGIQAEYLISHTYPLSLAIGYNHQGTNGGDINSFGVHLRYRFGTEGSLVSIDRNGPVSWDGGISL